MNIPPPTNQHQFKSGMKRNDSTGKPRFDLICPLSQEYDKTLLYRWAMLMAKGMEIYSARNWEQANGLEELESFKASAERHFRQAMSGDTTEDHFAAVLFNLNGIVYLMDKLKCDVKGNINDNSSR